MYEYLLDLVEQHLGDLIDEVIDEYYADKIDIEAEYEDLLRYITEKLAGKNRDFENIDKFEKLLYKLIRRKSIGKLIISYLVAKYIESASETDY